MQTTIVFNLYVFILPEEPLAGVLNKRSACLLSRHTAATQKKKDLHKKGSSSNVKEECMNLQIDSLHLGRGKCGAHNWPHLDGSTLQWQIGLLFEQMPAWINVVHKISNLRHVIHTRTHEFKTRAKHMLYLFHFEQKVGRSDPSSWPKRATKNSWL